MREKGGGKSSGDEMETHIGKRDAIDRTTSRMILLGQPLKLISIAAQTETLQSSLQTTRRGSIEPVRKQGKRQKT
eukprot:3423156-Pleurochrysis_carterae.AAC.1